MADYEIRHIDGRKVFIKHIGNTLWLFDDVFVYFSEGYVFTDGDVLRALDSKTRDIAPYKGAKDGYVLEFTFRNGWIVETQGRLTSCNDDFLTNSAYFALGQYYSWIGEETDE